MACKKVIVAGDVLGKFSTFFKRLRTVNEKSGPFDFVVCAGSFFSYDDEDSEDANIMYIAKEYNIGLQIYVLGPIIKSQKRWYKRLFTENLRGPPPFEDGFDIAVNVTYLGKKGIQTTIDGINIAFLSGVESDTLTDCSYTITEIDELINKASNVGRTDILITRNYPKNVNIHSLSLKSRYLKEMSDNGSPLVSKLAKYIQPRYHFCGATDLEFFEREPYRNHMIMQEQPKLVTRFISIAKVKDESKPKWLYAFSLTAAKFMSKEELTKQPDDTTENPYLNMDFDFNRVKREKTEPIDSNSNGSFFFQQPTMNNQRVQNNNNRNYNNRDRSNNNRGDNRESNCRNGKRQHSSNYEQEEEDKRLRSNENSCWFCLSSPQAEKHLIISVGDHSYLALCKGGLINHHLLILPIGHYRSITEIEFNPDLAEVAEEIGKFKNAIIDYFMSKEQVAVFFERNFKSAHLQLQVVAVPKDKISNLTAILHQECKERQMNLNEIRGNSSISSAITSDRASYFYIEFQGKRFFVGIKLSRGFALQFGRELLSRPEILDCPDRVEWRNCELDTECASNLVKEIRREFKNYDFTI